MLPSFVVSLLYVFVAISFFWMVLRWLDWLGGIRFKIHVIPQLKNDPMAAAIYFGARILAIAIIVATVL